MNESPRLSEFQAQRWIQRRHRGKRKEGSSGRGQRGVKSQKKEKKRGTHKKTKKVSDEKKRDP